MGVDVSKRLTELRLNRYDAQMFVVVQRTPGTTLEYMSDAKVLP